MGSLRVLGGSGAGAGAVAGLQGEEEEEVITEMKGRESGVEERRLSGYHSQVC